jgi:hypothetical protein
MSDAPDTKARDRALGLVVEHCIGRTILGVQVQPGINAVISLDGGAALVLPPDGGLAVVEPHTSIGRAA